MQNPFDNHDLNNLNLNPSSPSQILSRPNSSFLFIIWPTIFPRGKFRFVFALYNLRRRNLCIYFLSISFICPDHPFVNSAHFSVCLLSIRSHPYGLNWRNTIIQSKMISRSKAGYITQSRKHRNVNSWWRQWYGKNSLAFGASSVQIFKWVNTHQLIIRLQQDRTIMALNSS